MAKVRFKSLDGLRGVAAAVVILHHLALTVPVTALGYRAVDNSAAPFWDRVLVNSPAHLLWQGTEAVFLFFVLSGFVLTVPWLRARRSWRQYYSSRLPRLYLPVWASLAIAACVVALFYPRSPTGQTWWLDQHAGLQPALAVRDALLVLGVSNINSPLWSLQWEVLFSLLLPLYFRALRWCHGLRLGAVGIGALVVTSALGKVLHSEALQFLPIFGLGVILAMNIDALSHLHVTLSRYRFAIPNILALALLSLNSEWILRGLPGVPITVLAIARLSDLIASCVLIWIALTAPRATALMESRGLQWLGTRSFSLYLVHEPVIVTTAFLLGPALPAFAALTSVLIALALSEVFYRVVERPSHRVSREIGRRFTPMKTSPVTKGP